MKDKALDAFKARDRPLRHRRARRPTSPASLRVPLFVIGTPVFNWIYAKASELRGWQGDVDKVAGWSHTCLFCRARLVLAGVGHLGRGLLQLQRAAGRAVPALAGTGRLGPGRPWMAAVATVVCSGPPARRRRLPPREARAGRGPARGRAGASTDGALVGLRSRHLRRWRREPGLVGLPLRQPPGDATVAGPPGVALGRGGWRCEASPAACDASRDEGRPQPKAAPASGVLPPAGGGGGTRHRRPMWCRPPARSQNPLPERGVSGSV